MWKIHKASEEECFYLNWLWVRRKQDIKDKWGKWWTCQNEKAPLCVTATWFQGEQKDCSGPWLLSSGCSLSLQSCQFLNIFQLPVWSSEVHVINHVCYFWCSQLLKRNSLSLPPPCSSLLLQARHWSVLTLENIIRRKLLELLIISYY